MAKNKPTGQRSRKMSQVNQKKFLSKWKAKIKIYQGLEQTYEWFRRITQIKKSDYNGVFNRRCWVYWKALNRRI